MTTPRRRLVRPLPAPPSNPNNQRRLQKLRTRLEQERAALARWMTRLRRAFHAVERQQRLVARLDRQLKKLEEA